MKDVVAELNKEVCPVHSRNAKCRLTSEGIDINACCADFKNTLMKKLKALNTGKRETPPGSNLAA